MADDWEREDYRRTATRGKQESASARIERELDEGVRRVVERARERGERIRGASPVTIRHEDPNALPGNGAATRTYKERDCAKCGSTFLPTGPRNVYCPECQSKSSATSMPTAPEPSPAPAPEPPRPVRSRREPAARKKRSAAAARPRSAPTAEGGGIIATARQRYLELLLERAAQPDATDDLLDRIERLVGLREAA